MRLLIPALIAAGAALAALPGLAQPQSAPAATHGAQANAKTTILPGHWEYRYRVLGIPAGSESKCLKPKDIAQFANGICTKRYTCVYETKVVQDGKIALKGVWTDKKGRAAPVNAKGAYTPESFDLDIKLKTVDGLPLAGTMTAKRLSEACPVEPAPAPTPTPAS